MTRWRGLSGDPLCRAIGPRLIETQSALEYVDEIRGFRALVPILFRCDGPSWPDFIGRTILRRLVWTDALPFALLHDYLYREGATIVVFGQSISVSTRSFADRTMAEAMRTRPKTRPFADMVRVGLRVGGWPYWKRKPVDWRGEAP